MNTLYIEALISDLHFGAMDPNEQYKILKEQFLYKLIELPALDIVTITGDIFHRKFMANSDAISVACCFISELIDICGMKDASLLIIAGTYSHDADQIKLFYPLAQQARSRGIDVRIVEDIGFEVIKGKRILCIPELYGKGYDYYAKYLFNNGGYPIESDPENRYYDACYMHGTFVNSVYGKSTPNLDAEREPIFCMDDFVYCLGPIVSGHVHQPNCFESHFYYCGSPYRWQFGDEPDKGFIILIQDIRSHYYTIKYEEIISDKYITMDLDYLLDNDPHQTIAYINNLREQENIQYIKVVFNHYNPENINIIQSFYRNDKNVTIVDKSKNVNVAKDVEEVENKYKEYDYITNTAMTPEAKLVSYIKQYKGSTFITVEELTQILKDI